MLSDADTKTNSHSNMDANANANPDSYPIYFTYRFTHHDANPNRHAIYITDGYAYRLTFLYSDADPVCHPDSNIDSGFD